MRGFSQLEEAVVAVAAREDDVRLTTRSSLVWEVEEEDSVGSVLAVEEEEEEDM